MKEFWVTESLKVFLQSIYGGIQLGYGIFRLSRLRGPIVTIFGGKLIDEENKYAKQAHALAGQLVEKGFSIITGGGPGIMEAANCGAQEKKEKLGIKAECTLGIGVQRVDAEFENPCASLIRTRYFFSRKWLLMHYAVAIVVFPGGIGTVDELFEILNLQKFKKRKLIPIILIGSNYWQELIDWYDQAIREGAILAEYKNMFMITDDLEKVISLLTMQQKKE
ncbi:MAG: TIGR00730 family Rossman fold protein [Candidatus Babeliales bacterium]